MNNARWILKCGLGLFLGLVPFVGFSASDEQEASSLTVVFDGAQAPSQDAPVVPGNQGGQQGDEAPRMSPRMIEQNKEYFLQNLETAQKYHGGFVQERRRALVGGIAGGVGGGLYALAQYVPFVLSVAGYATGGILGLAALGLLLGAVGKDQKNKTGAGIVFDVVATVGLGALSVLSFLNPLTAATVALTALAVGGGAWGAINGVGAVIDLVRRNKAARRADYFLNELPVDERQKVIESLTGDPTSNGHTSA